MKDLNLLPVSYKKSLRRKWYVGFGAVGGLITCIALITLALIPLYKINIEELEGIRLDEKLLNPELVEIEQVLEEGKRLRRSRDYIEDMIDELGLPNQITREMIDMTTRNIPEGLKFSELNINPSENSIIIAGRADNSAKVTDYIIRLNNTSAFGHITYVYNLVSEPVLESLGWVDFNMQIKLSADGAGGEES